MQISAISTPSFKGNRDNVDALIGLDDNSLRRIAYAQTEAKFQDKRPGRISKALILGAPLVAGLGTALLTKGKSKIFSKEVSGLGARLAEGLKTTGLWTASLAAAAAVGVGKEKLSKNSESVRKFDNNYPLLSVFATLATAIGALALVYKGGARLGKINAPKFMQKATANVDKFLANNKTVTGMKNTVKGWLAKTPDGVKRFAKGTLDWAPTMMLMGGIFGGADANNTKNRDFVRNYAELKNKQAQVAQARVRELSMENDFLKTNPKNVEDLELLKNPKAGFEDLEGLE